MKKMNFTSQFLRLGSFAALVLAANLNLAAQTPCAVTQKVQVPINGPTGAPACKVALTPAMIGAPAGSTLSIRKGAAAQYAANYDNGSYPTSGGIVFGKNDLYNEYEIMVMHDHDGDAATPAQMCFSYVTPIDNTAPEVTNVLANITIKCTDLNNGKAPGPEYLGGYLDHLSYSGSNTGEGNITSGEIFNVSSLGGSRYGRVRDCSDFTVTWSDQAAVGDLCPMSPDASVCYSQTITRVWSFKDKFGNTSTVNQTITVVSPKIVIPGTLVAGVYESNFTDCTKNDSEADLPYIDWAACGAVKLAENASAGQEVMVAGKDYCGWSIQISTNPAMQLCGGSRMFTRNYKIKPCHPMSVAYNVEHRINVWDRTSPNVKLEYTDFLRVKEEQCFNMNGSKVTQYVYKTVRAEGGGSVTGGTSAGVSGSVKSLTTASFKVTPLVNTGTCSQASISIKLTADDLNCSKGSVTLTSDDAATGAANDGGLLFNGMQSMKIDGGGSVTITGSFTAPSGDPDVERHILVTDDCGNVTDIKLTIVIVDNLAPNSYCEDKQVSLNNKGEVFVTPGTFSSTSENNFGYTDNCAIVAPSSPMDTKGMFIRRTGSGDCWTRSLVLTCTDGESVKVDIRTIDDAGNYTDCCVTATLVNKAGPSCQSFMNVSTICTDPNLANLESFFREPTYYAPCGEVKVTSTTPSLSLSCGAGSVTKTWTFTNNGQSVQCSQTLTVSAVPGYRVLPLVDSTATCNYTYNEAVERARALDRVQLLDPAGTVTCAAPIVEVEKWEYSNSQYCKIVRIRYSFVDKCQRYQGLAADAASYVNFDQNGGTAGYTRYSNGYYQARQVADGSGFAYVFGYERYIMVNDRTAPTSVPPVVADICLGDNCKFTFSQTLTGSDLCGDGSTTGSNLAFNWSVVSPSGSVIATGNSSSVSHATRATGSLSDLAAGTYTVNYSVADYCGNRSFYSYQVTGKDCKTPFVLVHEKNLELGYDSRLNMGMGQVCVDDVLNNLGDNCTGYDYLYSKTRMQRASDAAVYAETLPTCLQFTCADKGQRVAVRVWTRDEAGNTNFVLNYITVQDNKGACTAPLSTITGTLATENGQSVKDVVVTGSVNGVTQGTANTNASGTYSFQAGLDQNVQVKAVKIATEDKYAGVTTFDIARISKHVLDIEKLASPYTMIAADVNKDGEIDAQDMLQIRNFILKKSSSLPGGVWRFIDKSYAFSNSANPFGEDFPEVVNLSKVPATATANFVAVKLGDVNTTYVAGLTGVQVRNSNALMLQAEDMQLVAGNEYTVDITSENFNAIAFQGTISLNGATVKSVKGGDLANINDGNFGVFTNEVTASWNGATKLNANVMSITFVANKTAKLSEVMTVGSSLTSAVANDAQGNEMNVNLKFTTGKVSGGEFALHQNTPNPVALETTIGFNLPKDEQARLTVYTVDGKTVLAKQIDGKAGVNQITINKSELNANGVMYYRLETAEHTATKKMIIIE
uniref:Dockerin domain-containing protein n=1 Tax=Daphnia magna TaxID=35525 RepID=A0A0P5A005_9CRUS